jgi:biopolymer transport protein ExbD
MVTRRKRLKAQINIIPLVDVLMVLLFFLLVSMQFKDQKALNINLPKIETAGENKIKKELLIGVDKEGTFFLNNQPVTIDELEAALKVASSINSEQSVLLMADEESYLKNVTQLIDLCRKVNLKKFKLQSR